MRDPALYMQVNAGDAQNVQVLIVIQSKTAYGYNYTELVCHCVRCAL